MGCASSKSTGNEHLTIQRPVSATSNVPKVVASAISSDTPADGNKCCAVMGNTTSHEVPPLVCSPKLHKSVHSFPADQSRASQQSSCAPGTPSLAEEPFQSRHRVSSVGSQLGTAGTTIASNAQLTQTPAKDDALLHDVAKHHPDPNPYDRLSSDSAKSTGSSGRSSFVLEGSADKAMPARSSLPVSANPRMDVSMLPASLQHHYLELAVLNTDAPVPLCALQLLWSLPSLADAAVIALQLGAVSALRVAELEDGSTWCMADPVHVQHAQSVCQQPLQVQHALLVDKYTSNGAVALVDLHDDGYIMLNLIRHLLAAGRFADAHQLLLIPSWLEQKLLAYGSSAVVADFRSFLQEQEDGDTKLVLQALQMAMATCLERPYPGTVCNQMTARLMAACTAGHMNTWYKEQRCLADAAVAKGISEGNQPVHLLPRTASLGQAGGLHRMTLRGHTGAIKKLIISPNGREIVTASADGSAHVWDMDIGDCMLQLAADNYPITALAISPDGNHCVTGSEKGSLFTWDLTSGKLHQSLPGHSNKITVVAYDPKGRYLVSASTDRTACIWHQSTGRCLHILDGHAKSVESVGVIWDVASSSTGAFVATASDDFTARIWESNNGNCLQVLEGHSGWVVAVEFIPGPEWVVTGSHDTTARIWHPVSGKCLHVLKGHLGRVNKVATSGDGHLVVTGSDDYTARVWRAKDGAAISLLEGHAGWISDVAISYDGSTVVTASGDHMAVSWNAATGQIENILSGHSDELTTVALTRKGRFAVTAAADSTARVWDLSATSLQKPENHSGKVCSLQVLPGHNKAVSIGEDCVLRLWDITTGDCLRAMKAHATSLNWLQVAVDGSGCTTVSADRKVCSWAVEGSHCSCTTVIEGSMGSRVKSVAVDAACKVAAVVLYDSTCSVWDLESAASDGAGHILAQLIRRAERDSSRAHTAGVNAIYLTADGTRALTVSKDCTARLWDIASGETTHVLPGHTDGVVAAAFSPGDELVATASYDASVKIWSSHHGICLARLPHVSPVTSVSFSPSGNQLLSISAENNATLWDVDSSSRIAVLSGHRDTINSAVFSHDGQYVATASQDSTLMVWRTVDGSCIAIYLADASLTCAAFSGDPGVDMLVVGDASGALHFLDFPHATLL